MKISWILLTYNRKEKVERSMDHNRANAGTSWDEIVWVDNGSTDGVRDFMLPIADTAILNRTNLGCAKGFNRAIVMATGDLIVIVGSDMLLPKDWLKTMKTYYETVPKTGVVSIYSNPLSVVPERIRGPAQRVNGLDLVPAIPFGCRMWSRELQKDLGYFREDFGLYGWEEVYHSFHAQRVCEEKGLLNYVIPDLIAEHMGTEGVRGFDGKDDREYHEFKKREVNNPRSLAIMNEGYSHGFNYFNPYV